MRNFRLKKKKIPKKGVKQPVNAVIMKVGLFLSSRSKDIVVLVSILNTTQFQILNLSFAREVLEDFIHIFT